MTIYEKFKITADKNGNRNAVLWKEKGAWQSYSYSEFFNQVNKIASGLIKLGVEKEDKIALLSENRWEWLATDLAINKIGAISVPIHAVSNADTIEYILKDSEASYLFVSENLYKKHLTFLETGIDLDEIIILSNGEDSAIKNVLYFKDILNYAAANSNFVGEDGDVASIIYTSGTTGEPKGVMLSNKNFFFDVNAVSERIKVYPEDIFLSFLPLSHVLERTGGSYLPMIKGASIAYAESIKKLADNLVEIKPTILVSVPKIFEKMYEKIFANIKEKRLFVKKMFFWALRQKNKSFSKQIADFIILKKIRKKVFGGRLRIAVSGGASINEKILRFFTNIGVKIIEGYGLTETAPIICVNSLENNKIGTVGMPLNDIAVKISAEKEILVKGDNITQGYWRKEEMTKETFDSDGWFKTGDMGFLDRDNFLTIIGRKKEIIVTTNGKNIAPEKIEGIINLSPYIEQSLIVGHRRQFLASLIVPDFKSIEEKFGKVDSKLAREIIEGEIEKINRQLEHHEKIAKIKILDKQFTIEAGELTPTLKVRRKIIETKFHDIINGIYSEF
ncbi:MAG: long-chain fatty acid--CoA ligase [Patescibacteria group bacterium]|nr:long-chain fatty acid--CoA ligase [Patescibacteria group bacterium]